MLARSQFYISTYIHISGLHMIPLMDHAKPHLANFGYSLKVRSLKICNLGIYLDIILGILKDLKG